MKHPYPALGFCAPSPDPLVSALPAFPSNAAFPSSNTATLSPLLLSPLVSENSLLYSYRMVHVHLSFLSRFPVRFTYHASQHIRHRHQRKKSCFTVSTTSLPEKFSSSSLCFSSRYFVSIPQRLLYSSSNGQFAKRFILHLCSWQIGT